jgi:hypothetical protein
MRTPGSPPTHSHRTGGSHTDMRKVLRPSRLIWKAPLDVGPSLPGGDTVTEVMWGAHSGHRSTSASRCHASSSGASTSNTRLNVALAMNSTSDEGPTAESPGTDGTTLLDIPAERTVSVKEDPQQEQEWIGQLSLIYSALIGIGVVMVQPFLTAASLDLSAKVSVVAFSVAIPLLAALVLVNQHEVFRRRVTKSILVETARVVAQLCAFVGVVAGFWHILWIAGVGMLAGGLAGVAIQSVGYWRLERDRLLARDQQPPPEEPGDTES